MAVVFIGLLLERVALFSEIVVRQPNQFRRRFQFPFLGTVYVT